ncbi:DUF4142 domain-containing protein [Variovorax sp. LT1R16]|uniref:DUF4142 domain-containing protein n=1 Tax=Variovorax sp. LT1R16 TaxID=3443728 RepID=UPI003F466114
MMVDGHTKGLADVKKLAAAKGTDLPDGPDVMHKAVALEFKALTGDIFNSRYIKQAGVGDHEATEKLLKKTQVEAKDADLQAMAGEMLPVVQAHLKHAQDLAAKKQAASGVPRGSTQRRGGSGCEARIQGPASAPLETVQPTASSI